MSYNTALIRQLLIDAFSNNDLVTFCYDNFRAVYDERFGIGMAKGEMAQSLLDYVNRQCQMERLLNLVREANSAQYVRYEERLISVEHPMDFHVFPATEISVDSAGVGLQALQSLLNVPSVHAAVIVFQVDFESICEQTRTLVQYKRLHDLFQQLQEHYQRLDENCRRVTTDVSVWNILSAHGAYMEGIICELLEAANQAPSLTHEAWVWQIDQARGELRSVVEDCATPQLQMAITRLNRVLSREPSRFNTRLVEIVRGLRLQRVVQALEIALEKLPGNVFDSIMVQRLRGGADAITRLTQEIKSLVDLHDAWQVIDDDLRRIDGNLGLGLAELELALPDLMVKTEELCGGNSANWAQSLMAIVIDLDSAIQTANETQARWLFRRYRGHAVIRFNRVDQDLLTLCEELQRVVGPLDLLLGAL